MTSSNVIFVGDVNGQLSAVFSKLNDVHAKRPFAFAIIVGNLFADESTTSDDENQQVADLLSGKIKVNLPTYFALGTRPLPDSVITKLSSNGGELCPNLSILGRKVSIKTSEGFKIVAIGGTHVSAEDAIMNEYSPTYSDKDAVSAQAFKDVDFLITSDWPAEVRDGCDKTYSGESPAGVSSISELCAAIKPRFHFSTSSAYYDRDQFFHPGPPPRSITRFMSLAPFRNSEGRKDIYAFSTVPSKPPPEILPPDCTSSPFIRMMSKKRKAEETDMEENQYEFRFASSNGGGYRDGGHRRRKRHHKAPPTIDDCFFCLRRPEFEAHMVTSINEHAFVTIAKGPLSTSTTYPALDHPLHMLIIPMEHAPTFRSLPEDERAATIAEMQRYRECIHSMIASKSTQGADGEAQLGAVTWEISRAGGFHLQWQLLPVPVDMVKKKIIEAAFEVEAENLHYPKFVKQASQIKDAEEGDYFKIMIWSESTQKEMVMPLGYDSRFDLQFGRRVMAKLLKLESRTQWRDVAQTQAEEEADANAFKSMFEKFDFSIVED